jgi:apolipoprotein D and lipocalin family protein
MRPVVLAAALLAAFAIARADTTSSSAGIDPEHYLGRWYEIARLPNRFQENCSAATSDWTRQSNGQFDVVQTCHIGTPTGPAKIWRGAGRVVDPSTSVIRIGFFGGFLHMDYRILDRADDYSWCILTNGNPKFVWIMSKRPNMPPAQKTVIVARAKRLGFNISALIYDEQPST